MKRKLLAFICLIAIGFSSCSLIKTPSRDVEAYLKENFKKFVDYLDEKDSDGIKSLFSKWAFEYNSSFDDGLEELYDFYKEKSTKITDGFWGEEAEFEDGEYHNDGVALFYVKTKKTVYSFDIVSVSDNSFGDEYNGFLNVIVSTKKKRDKESFKKILHREVNTNNFISESGNVFVGIKVIK